MSNLDSIQLPTNPRFQDLTGRVFGRWTVLGFAGVTTNHDSRWSVRCACGTTKQALGRNISSGKSKSCGCLSSELLVERSIKHNMTKTPEFRSWRAMWERCTDPNNKRFHLYKDRTPPPEWRSFEVFYAELGPKPSSKHSVERIDNGKPYGPGNCRWATAAEQSRNTTTNVWVLTPDGRREVLVDACKLVGINYGNVCQQRHLGASVEEASAGLLHLA